MFCGFMDFDPRTNGDATGAVTSVIEGLEAFGTEVEDYFEGNPHGFFADPYWWENLTDLVPGLDVVVRAVHGTIDMCTGDMEHANKEWKAAAMNVVLDLAGEVVFGVAAKAARLGGKLGAEAMEKLAAKKLASHEAFEMSAHALEKGAQSANIAEKGISTTVHRESAQITFSNELLEHAAKDARFKRNYAKFDAEAKLYGDRWHPWTNPAVSSEADRNAMGELPTPWSQTARERSKAFHEMREGIPLNEFAHENAPWSKMSPAKKAVKKAKYGKPNSSGNIRGLSMIPNKPKELVGRIHVKNVKGSAKSKHVIARLKKKFIKYAKSQGIPDSKLAFKKCNRYCCKGEEKAADTHFIHTLHVRKVDKHGKFFGEWYCMPGCTYCNNHWNTTVMPVGDTSLLFPLAKVLAA